MAQPTLDIELGGTGNVMLVNLAGLDAHQKAVVSKIELELFSGETTTSSKGDRYSICLYSADHVRTFVKRLTGPLDLPPKQTEKVVEDGIRAYFSHNSITP